MGQDVVRVARDDRLRRGDVGNDAIVSASLEALEPITCGMHGRRYDNEVAFSAREPFVHTRIIDESVLVERTLLPRFLEWLGMASDADDDGRVVKLLPPMRPTPMMTTLLNGIAMSPISFLSRLGGQMRTGRQLCLPSPEW